MKIAVTYDNGSIFQHFGKSRSFKIYQAEDGCVTAANLIGTDGLGHEALAGLLADYNVDVLICGGMGAGAEAALKDAGIEIYSGVTGDADEAVAKFLSGELTSEGVNCHHHEEEHHCDCGCGGHCDCGCEEEEEECGCGCGCGCHEHRLMFEGPNAGKTVKVHYRGTFNDGTQFDSSYDRGEPLEFVCAAGMMIPGFDRAVADMKVGDKKDIHLMPEQAYGPKDPNAIVTFKISELRGSEGLTVGQRVYFSNQYGQPIPVTVTEKTEETITVDANHEMAGKELNFSIEMVEIK